MEGVYQKILKQYWGYDSFRGIQEEIIHSIGRGKDTLGLMPTGGGKSITFQVPALAMEGMCLVITPLIALMKDQVQNLRQRGIRALAIYSGMSRQEILITLENAIFGNYKFLYISPERLGTELFRAKLKKMKISMLTVDESHCISQWGYDFRPAYLKIAEVRKLLPGVPVLALTATATPEVIKDIQLRLGFCCENVFRMSFERQNLTYVVRRTDDKHMELLRILRRMSGSAIIYVRNRRRTQEVTELLRGEGITADFYHAGVDDATRDVRQQRWQQGECRVIVATNAFGMGIDKADVRIVLHLDLPNSIEAYFQEAGRAGRDGQQAYAVILYNPQDSNTLKQRIASEFPERNYIRQIYEHLQYYYQMAMGDGQGCVREFDLSDFCRKFKHFPVQADSALKLLTQAGYLEYTEEQDSASRLRFILRRDELYRLHGFDDEADRLIQIVLRLYTGLFTDFAFINESALATRTGLTPQKVYDLLVRLDRMGIVKYIPHKRTPYIIYVRARVEADRIVIPSTVYEERRERCKQRIAAMLEYVESNTVCRSRLLLHYFGEHNPHNCGQCDVCCTLHQEREATLTDRLLKLLTDGTPLSPQAVQEALGSEREPLAELLQDLLDQGKLISRNGLLYLCP